MREYMIGDCILNFEARTSGLFKLLVLSLNLIHLQVAICHICNAVLIWVDMEE
uniref:Uncharacterized protein n=1 Tax=Arundo donax TaxID=35708 RepID=A0A0A9DFP7_ARUDO